MGRCSHYPIFSEARKRCKKNKPRKQKKSSRNWNKGGRNVKKRFGCGSKSQIGECSMDNTLDMAAYGGTLGFDPSNLKTSNFRKY